MKVYVALTLIVEKYVQVHDIGMTSTCGYIQLSVSSCPGLHQCFIVGTHKLKPLDTLESPTQVVPTFEVISTYDRHKSLPFFNEKTSY